MPLQKAATAVVCIPLSPAGSAAHGTRRHARACRARGASARVPSAPQCASPSTWPRRTWSRWTTAASCTARWTTSSWDTRRRWGATSPPASCRWAPQAAAPLLPPECAAPGWRHAVDAHAVALRAPSSPAPFVPFGTGSCASTVPARQHAACAAEALHRSTPPPPPPPPPPVRVPRPVRGGGCRPAGRRQQSAGARGARASRRCAWWRARARPGRRWPVIRPRQALRAQRRGLSTATLGSCQQPRSAGRPLPSNFLSSNTAPGTGSHPPARPPNLSNAEAAAAAACMPPCSVATATRCCTTHLLRFQRTFFQPRARPASTSHGDRCTLGQAFHSRARRMPICIK